MTPIKIVLIVLLLLVLRAFWVQKSLLLVKRLIAFFMSCLLLLLIVFPDISTRAANIVGVGRGTDLIFYLSNFFFLFLIIGLWQRTIALTATITKLSRAIALQNPDKPTEKDDKADQLSG